jgi:mannose-6-phosphate isomerase-like protein (cupin superfamily)
MEKNGTLIRSAEKKRCRTANSEYVFHVSPYSNDEKIGYYEASFKNAGQNKSLHYHKIITEVFTVLHGEFYFNIGNEEYILKANDTIIIPPLAAHGFRAKLPNSRLQFIFTGITDREGFFVGLAKIANGEIVFNEDEFEIFCNKYDQFSVN